MLSLRKFYRAISLGWLTLYLVFIWLAPVQVKASKLGVHIMEPQELQAAVGLIKPSNSLDNSWHFVTIPLTLDDLDKKDQWQEFFNQAKKHKVVPLVRLATRFKDGAWQVPTKKDVVDQIGFLSSLDWPTDKLYLVAYNEPNHAAEWGGRVDPAGYGRMLEFVADWAHTEEKNFVVLPAAVDQAAPNSAGTLEAFNFLEKMTKANPGVLKKIDVWNAHAYPNPGFIASPYSSSKMSLKSFLYELDWLKEKTGKDYLVAITETGWRQTPFNSWRLKGYYTYALKNIWSDKRVIAVTPFTLKGSPGPFSAFSFLDEGDKPTAQYRAFQTAIEKVGHLLQVGEKEKVQLEG